MKRIHLIIALIQILSSELIAQQDSLPNTDAVITSEKDSVNKIVSPTLIPDSSYWKPGIWGEYGRPCIVPLIIDTFDFSSLFVPIKSFALVSHYNEEGAEADIKKGNPRILFSGGFGGMPDFSSKADKAFQKKYRVEFFSQGCLRSGEHEDESGYNQVIFDYLDKKYGMAWRYELRDDAIGFKAPASIGEYGGLHPFLANYFIKHLTYAIVSHYNKEGAEADIKGGNLRILFPGGFSGVSDFSSKADKAFQKKYRVEFFSDAYLWQVEHKDKAGYNQVIFDYLDKKYGMAWRYELRDDAIGFKAPASITEAAPKLASPLALQIANPENSPKTETNADPETSVWWYILPTSGFALLLSLYFIKRKKD